MEWTVYILRSKKDGLHYTGMTQDLDRRLKEHNRGRSKFTRMHMPWELIYTEKFSTKEDAGKREKYFKTSAGRRYLGKVVGSPV